MSADEDYAGDDDGRYDDGGDDGGGGDGGGGGGGGGDGGGRGRRVEVYFPEYDSWRPATVLGEDEDGLVVVEYVRALRLLAW
jgi:hypothetical protein